ncbi:MAG TPA: glutamine--tRNA ligase, partial [Clostridia bacterium]|nr:glutamine--tRNA ligase [Clostridia bacterium]
DFALLEHCVREDLNKKSKRVMAVLNPLKVIIDNYPDGIIEEFQTENNPENPEEGTRTIKFSKEIYIEQSDFMEEPPRKYFRLSPGAEVRLKNTYYVKCESVVKNVTTGEVLEIHCSYDPETRGGSSPDGRKVKGTIHWVSAPHAIDCEVRLYNQLFITNDPEEDNDDGDFRKNINPESIEILKNCKVEMSLKNAKPEENYQFIRTGYFTLDSKAYEQGKLVFNRTLSLKDSWAKIAKAQNTKK